MRSQREAALKRALGERGVALRKVTGTSMIPTLRPGEIVFVEPCSSPEPGDIVAFALGEGLLVHRVVRSEAGSVTCRGDNRLADDPPVPLGAILGKVVQVAGRKSVPDRHRDVTRVRLRMMRRHVGLRVRRILGEIRLFAAQAGLGAAPPFAPMQLTLWDERDPDATADRLLKPPARFDHDSLAAVAPGGDPVIVPAGIFSRLPSRDRQALLLGLAGRSVIVWAESKSTAGRLVRLLSALRVILLRIGLVIGEPGDVYIPPGLATPGGRAHVSTADELRLSLVDAGGQRITVEARTVHGVSLLRGRAHLACMPAERGRGPFARCEAMKASSPARTA